MKSRHLGRSVALQTLYSLDFNERIHDVQLPYSEGFAGLTEDEEKEFEQEVLIYASYLVNGVLSHLDEEDELIGRFSTKRSIENIYIVDRNILRMSIFQLLYCKDIHPNIVIDEAVKLSREFSTEVNYKFINGLLDAVSRHLHDSPEN